MPDKCFVGYCSVDLLIEYSQSLKDKRRVISSLKKKIHNQFNVAVCEHGDLSLWQRTQLGMVTCSNDQRIVESILREATEYIQKSGLVTILNSESTVIPARI
jgi:uncharacterized protein YlxP (DUF503 family)